MLIGRQGPHSRQFTSRSPCELKVAAGETIVAGLLELLDCPIDIRLNERYQYLNGFLLHPLQMAYCFDLEHVYLLNLVFTAEIGELNLLPGGSDLVGMNYIRRLISHGFLPLRRLFPSATVVSLLRFWSCAEIPLATGG